MANLLTATTGSFVSILNTITNTADAANSSLDMLSSFVTEARRNQRERQLIQRDDFRRNLILESSEERAKRELELDRKVSSDPEFAQRFNSQVAHYESLFATFDAQTQS